MSEMDFNVDHLTRETFEINPDSQFDRDFLINPKIKKEEEVDHKKPERSVKSFDELFSLVDDCEQNGFYHSQDIEGPSPFPETPGVFYYLDKSTSSFCIRGLETSNIKHKVENLTDKNLESLKLAEAGKHSFKFFETMSLEIAQVIREQLFNKRFPIDEESLCNIADPGFSWWLNDSEEEIEIYFKSQGLERGKNFKCLGPMGDIHVAQVRLKMMESFFYEAVGVDDFHVDAKSMKISCSRDTEIFRKFRDVFTDGVMDLREEEFKHLKYSKTFYLYFKELAALKNFWSQLEVN